MSYFVEFLRTFYEITMRLSGSKYTTANSFFSELSELHFQLENSCTDSAGLLSAMATRMKIKYDKYWGNIEKINRLLFVAVILDPRVKLAVLEFWVNSVLGAVKAGEFMHCT